MKDRFELPDEPRMRECSVCNGWGVTLWLICKTCKGTGEVPAPVKSSGNIDPDDTEGREL